MTGIYIYLFCKFEMSIIKIALVHPAGDVLRILVKPGNVVP